MSPLSTIRAATDGYTAEVIITALRRDGFIIVDKDSIRRAQREAVAQYKEDRK